MKKKIAILGSTGSIGKTLLKIIQKNSKNFEIVLLTANSNYKELNKQTKTFKVKNVIITNKLSYKKFKKINKNKKINIFNDFKNLKKIFKSKIDYSMSAIIGLEGLEPTLNIIKYSKTIAIANKESVICAWSLINKELKKNNTSFIPVDSEHFSIWYALNNNLKSKIEKVYLTASGGPLLNVSKNRYDKLKIHQILKHPNWRMGKKISTDSATMMNKVFEIIEAKKLFNIEYDKLSILIHPKSYIHAIIKFNSGMIKIIAHDTTMEVPIFNSLYLNKNKIMNSKQININSLNNLKLQKADSNKFPLLNIFKNLPKKDSLYETVLVAANDELVNLFLNKKIKFNQISKKLLKFVNLKQFKKYRLIKPKNIRDIINLSNYVRLKINYKSV